MEVLNIIGESTPLSVSASILALQALRYFWILKSTYRWGSKQYSRWKRGRDWEVSQDEQQTPARREYRSAQERWPR